MPDRPALAADDDSGAASAQATAAILRLMEREGISRSELARRLRASPAHVTQILRGDTNFTLASLEKLAAALGAALEVRLEPAGESRGPGAPTEATAPATGGTAVRDRPLRRPRPRPAPSPEPDSSWRVW